MQPQLVQMVGLMLDVIGFALIYSYGIHRSGATEAGPSVIVIGHEGEDDPNAPTESDLRRWRFLAHTGFALVTLGFVTQGVGLRLSF